MDVKDELVSRAIGTGARNEDLKEKKIHYDQLWSLFQIAAYFIHLNILEMR